MEYKDELEDMEHDALDEDEIEEDSELDPNLYRFVKRVPQRLPSRKNDIYISRASKYVGLYNRARELLDDPSISEIHLHGLGAAMNRTIQLALFLTSKDKSLIMSPTTSSVQLIDEYEPLVDELEPVEIVRYNSAIQIKISKRTNK